METKKIFQGFVSNFYRPALVSKNDRIQFFSLSCSKLLDRKNLSNVYLPDLLYSLSGVSLPHCMRTQSRDMLFTTGGRSFSVNFISVHIIEDIYFHVFIDTSPLHSSFMMQFLQIQQSPIDNLWVLAENLQIIYRQANAEAKVAVGHSALDSVEDREKLQKALNEAKEHSNEVVQTDNRLTYNPSDGLREIHISIMYMPPIYTSGDYLAATRKTRPVNDIINRMKEAVLVSTDKELAKALHISPSAMSKARLNQSPPLDMLYFIFYNYKVSLDWLLTGKGKKYI